MSNPYIERLRDRSYRVLLERNLKLTKPRRALLDFLLSQPGWHFQAEDLLAELNQRQPGVVSRATVYRTLELLAEAGVLTKIRVHEHSFRYELADVDGHHHHLIDIQSGRVVCFRGDDELHAMLSRICAQQGFVESYHVLEVFGEFKPQTATRRRPRRATAPPPGLHATG